MAKAAQNPIANLISVPFQSNWNFGVGPNNGTQYVLNIQPVIPISMGKDWIVITRWITPILVQPDLGPGVDSVAGLGDINPSFFFSPKNTGNITVGFGPTFVLPTATDELTGQGKWSAGPAGVVVWTQGKWVIGALVNQIWSFAGDSDRQAVSQFLFQPFINYNLPNGWYLTSSPIITANWMADSGDQWAVPLGGGVGKLFKINKQPINASLQAYGYVVKPEGGPEWTLRFQIQLLFPK
ncbi:MAG TPA: neuromedin U [Leptolyngbyaceae cyanobacterium M33_DOE_097]|uniref:Neuromedin U n=1 Tax=Oscillatoriales cyanobacterium SpSt-418 TaxID=2282169 RepID=A0A7C3KGJ2_9CYAN|nr:neuromedin U [Leptolyngbyaceae cyanobacterium M33_DOE_097]